MSLESFKTLYKLVLSKYQESLSAYESLSETERLRESFFNTIFNKLRDNLDQDYDNFIQQEDTKIGEQTARTCVLILKEFLSRKFEDAELVQKFEALNASILRDPHQWVIDEYELALADLQPDVESMSGTEDEIAMKLLRLTNNGVMEHQYKHHIQQFEDRIKYLIYLTIQNSSDTKLLNRLIEAIYATASILEGLSFDLTLQNGHLGSGKSSPFENIFKEYFNNENGRTLHIVYILDGAGDFIHFKNWLSAYEEEFPDQSDVMIMFHSEYHSHNQIEDMINSLPPDHCLKAKLSNNITIVDIDSANITLKRMIYEDNFFSNPVSDAKSTYNSIFAISHLNMPMRIQLNNYALLGLPCCMINEMGVLEIEPSKYESFTFGIAENEQCCGMFFDNYTKAKDVYEIIEAMSDRLQEIIFGADYKMMTLQEKKLALDKLDIISGYYQSQRNTYPLETLIKEKAKIGRKTKLIITGQSLIPEELQHIKADNNCSIACCNLNNDEYQILMQLLQLEARHIFFSSGDNTFATSISIGKPILFLNRSLDHPDRIKELKHKSIADFIEVLMSKYKQLNSQNKIEEAKLLMQIIEFTKLSLQYTQDTEAHDKIGSLVIPSDEALFFYRDVIVPQLKHDFAIKAHLHKIVGSLEARRENRIKRPRVLN